MGRPAHPDSISVKWARSRELIRQAADDAGSSDRLDRAFDLEVDVLQGPICSLEDALAKLSAVELAFVEGERTDGADANALRQTIRWLTAIRARRES